MLHIADDAYNKLRKNIGNDFGKAQPQSRLKSYSHFIAATVATKTFMISLL
jgi:hypothetical protein